MLYKSVKLLVFVPAILIIGQKSSVAQADEPNNCFEYVVDSAEIADYRFGYGIIKTSDQLAALIDTIYSGSIVLHGLRNFDFIDCSQKYKEITSMSYTTNVSISIPDNVIVKYNEWLYLEGFVIEDFSKLIHKIQDLQGGYFINVKRCQIYNFSNWSTKRIGSTILTIKNSIFFNPSFRNIHNNFRAVCINHSNLTYIDSPDIYMLRECDLSQNKIYKLPLIPKLLDGRSRTLVLLGNQIVDYNFITINHPEALTTMSIRNGKARTIIELEY